MYDLSSKFNVFYSNHVVLSRDDQSELFNKKDINLKRLKDGLAEYNAEHSSNYRIVDDCVQGSAAMYTIVQNENNDYDIDVAIVFEKSNLGDLGPLAVRNIIADALGRKTKQFNAEPEVKTSCVRVKYEDGYHIDFAIYRRAFNSRTYKYDYEHAGSEWSQRDLKGLTEWFELKNENSNEALRKVIRLSKMFCKSRSSWKNMPSGLVQTIVCEKELQNHYSRIDELFYYTMKSITENFDDSVLAPVDNYRELITRKVDKKRMKNWKNRLKSKLEDLDILFKDNCSKQDAIQAWYGFFNHDFWYNQLDESIEYNSIGCVGPIKRFNETEEFIEDFFEEDIKYSLTLNCFVEGSGFRKGPLSEFLRKIKFFLPHHMKIHCILTSTNVPPPYDVYWKVKNVGPESERRNEVRGQIIKRGEEIVENSKFYGNHYIECYIVKDRVCVARRRVNVAIGRG